MNTEHITVTNHYFLKIKNPWGGSSVPGGAVGKGEDEV